MLDFLDGIKNVLPIIKNFALAIGVVLALFAAAAGIYILRTVLGPFIRVIQWLIAYTPRKEPNDIVKGLIYGLRMLVWGCIVAGVVWFTFHEKSEAWIMDMETHVAHQEQPGGKMFGAAVITTFLFGLALAAGAVYYFRTKEPPVEIVESAPRIVEKIVEKFVQAKQTLPVPPPVVEEAAPPVEEQPPVRQAAIVVNRAVPVLVAVPVDSGIQPMPVLPPTRPMVRPIIPPFVPRVPPPPPMGGRGAHGTGGRGGAKPK